MTRGLNIEARSTKINRIKSTMKAYDSSCEIKRKYIFCFQDLLVGGTDLKWHFSITKIMISIRFTKAETKK